MNKEFEMFQGRVPRRTDALNKRKEGNTKVIAAFGNNVATASAETKVRLERKIAQKTKQNEAADVAIGELALVGVRLSQTSVPYTIDEQNPNGELVSLQRARVNRKASLEERIASNTDFIAALQDDINAAESSGDSETAELLIMEKDTLESSIDAAQESLGELAFVEIVLV